MVHQFAPASPKPSRIVIKESALIRIATILGIQRLENRSTQHGMLAYPPGIQLLPLDTFRAPAHPLKAFYFVFAQDFTNREAQTTAMRRPGSPFSDPEGLLPTLRTKCEPDPPWSRRRGLECLSSMRNDGETIVLSTNRTRPRESTEAVVDYVVALHEELEVSAVGTNSPWSPKIQALDGWSFSWLEERERRCPVHGAPAPTNRAMLRRGMHWLISHRGRRGRPTPRSLQSGRQTGSPCSWCSE